jgi:branched-chain amino acid transport system permease protein
MSRAGPVTGGRPAACDRLAGSWRGDALLAVILLLALFLAPLYLRNDYYIRVAVLVCIFGAASIGWNLLGGYANQVSLGHAVFFGIGAYAVLIVQTELGLVPWVAMPIGIAVSVLVALLIGWPCFQLSGHYFALGTLALLEIAKIIAGYWSSFTGGPVGLTLPILPSGPGNLQFDTSTPYLYVAGTFLVIALLVAWWVRTSRIGLRLDAIRLNPHAAMLAGVNLFRTKMLALVVGAALVSVAGSLYGTLLQFIDPETAFSFNTTVNMALFAIVGGVGYWWGPILGAALLVPLSELASLKLTGHLSALAQVAYGLLLVVLIIVQPRGIGGWLNGLWRRWSFGGGR